MRLERKLTNRIVEAAEPGRYSDGGGLYLDVKSPQSRFWSFRYRFGGKTREMGLGPAGFGKGAMLLSEARKKAAKLDQVVRAGVDPLDESVTDPPNLYQEYVRERDARAEGRRQLTAMIAAGTAPPDYYNDPEFAWACLSGDSSVQHDLVRARQSPDLPPIWEAQLDQFRTHGMPLFALFALAVWPANTPLALELRWFLQRAIGPLLEAANSDNKVDVEAVRTQVLLNLGLGSGTQGKGPDLSAYRRMFQASRAEHLMEEAMKTEKNRKNALHEVGQKMGGKGRSAVEELRAEGAAISKAERMRRQAPCS